MNDIKELFKKFITGYNTAKYDQIWQKQYAEFKIFWNNYILSSDENEYDIDQIIKLLDRKARGFNSQTDEAVAQIGLYQGTWYRIFNDLKSKKDIQEILNEIFNNNDDDRLIQLIDKLHQNNQSNKNGLTGKNANALNALLFINNPRKYLSCVSLNHRKTISDYFKLSSYPNNKSYGTEVILSSKLIIDELIKLLGSEYSPRTIAVFLYSDFVKPLWNIKAEKDVINQGVEPEPELVDSDFQIEKHLEDFIVANWEQTILAKEYELLVKDDELVSQQYNTPIGKIDLLVKEKKTGNYVIIELKKGQTSDDTIGQLARYMGWVKKELSRGEAVKGIIIAAAFDSKLKYAANVVPNTKILRYKINFLLESVE